MEEAGEGSRVHISDATHRLVCERFECQPHLSRADLAPSGNESFAPKWGLAPCPHLRHILAQKVSHTFWPKKCRTHFGPKSVAPILASKCRTQLSPQSVSPFTDLELGIDSTWWVLHEMLESPTVIYPLFELDERDPPPGDPPPKEPTHPNEPPPKTPRRVLSRLANPNRMRSEGGGGGAGATALKLWRGGSWRSMRPSEAEERVDDSTPGGGGGG